MATTWLKISPFFLCIFSAKTFQKIICSIGSGQGSFRTAMEQTNELAGCSLRALHGKKCLLHFLHTLSFLQKEVSPTLDSIVMLLWKECKTNRSSWWIETQILSRVVHTHTHTVGPLSAKNAKPLAVNRSPGNNFFDNKNVHCIIRHWNIWNCNIFLNTIGPFVDAIKSSKSFPFFE
jgi:hypothetical protein